MENQIIWPKAILFDFDGTLIDSEPIALECLDEFAKKRQFTLTDEIRSLVTGLSYIDVFRRISLANPQLGNSESLLRGYLQILNIALDREAILLPGVEGWLKDAAFHSLLGLVSGSFISQIVSVLERFNIRDYFSVIVAAEDVTRGKPAPDCYIRACELFAFEPADFIVFEDSSLGIAAANAAGMFSVGVMAGNRGCQDLHAASHVISSFAESDLAEILSHYSAWFSA